MRLSDLNVIPLRSSGEATANGLKKMGFLNGLAEMFKDSALSALGAGFQALQDPQAFLKDDLPQNADPIAKWIQSRNRRACRLHARKEAAGEYSSLGALRRPRYERVCGPYLDSIGEGQTSEGSYGPPFTGGQCYNAFYSVTVSGPNRCDISGVYQNTIVARGPISGLQITVNTGYLGGCAGAPGDARSVSVIGKDGQSYSIGLANIHKLDAPNYKILSVSPFNNAPNNCGNPPNEYNPPQYPPNLPPIGPPDTSTPPPGGDGGDDVTVDDDGNIRICENGDCSNPFPPGGGGDPSEDPGEEDGDPNENNPSDPTDDITGCASEGQILTGIKIEITQVPVNENPGSGGFYRNVCWVWMGPSQDQLDLVTDGRFLESGQFVIPDSNNCRCYRVRPSPLWGLSVQAYSRPEKED